MVLNKLNYSPQVHTLIQHSSFHQNWFYTTNHLQLKNIVLPFYGVQFEWQDTVYYQFDLCPSSLFFTWHTLKFKQILTVNLLEFNTDSITLHWLIYFHNLGILLFSLTITVTVTGWWLQYIFLFYFYKNCVVLLRI